MYFYLERCANYAANREKLLAENTGKYITNDGIMNLDSLVTQVFRIIARVSNRRRS